ncbi:uncharacterized mitochondrial protein AtMg00810-like [Nicotiana sylvestris]|uniref:uncharacterized mitochondrial protein AtMg00810-like n=1 Tax=Nicotiana sylvestris TaxID=4096 RepID=UPI00388C9B4B
MEDSSVIKSAHEEIFFPDTMPSTESAELRKLVRTKKALGWLKDFVTPATNFASHVSYPIQNSVDYTNISPAYKYFLTALTSVAEPRSFKEASADPRWVEAMKTEISALEENKTWELVKYKANGDIERFKARLVAKGYNQQEGLDYTKIFSPVVKIATQRSVDNNVVVILVFVDDMLITGNSLKLIEATKDQLNKTFKMKDIGELKYFLGIELCRSTKGFLMNQRKYALELIGDLGLNAAKTAWTPLEYNQKFTSKKLDDITGVQDDDALEDKGKYQRRIGKLLYMTLNRLDIAFAVQTLSQFMQQPKRRHWEAALRVVRYIKREPGVGILMSSRKANVSSAYCDVDWASCPNTRKSVTSFLVKYGDSPVNQRSKTQYQEVQQKLNTEAW